MSRKVDWDLKRILQKSQDRLERRTQRAIAELIRKLVLLLLRLDSRDVPVVRGACGWSHS